MRRLSLLALPFGAVILFSGLVARPASVVASTALRMDISDLTRQSGLVLEGRVLSTEALEANGLIETRYLVQVERTFVGEDRAFRTIRIPGGVLANGRGLILSGMPRIVPSERVLLFLSREGATGVRMPVGLGQGKFTVVQRADGSKALVRSAEGTTLIDRTGALQVGEGRSVLDYADVVARIEAGRGR